MTKNKKQKIIICFLSILLLGGGFCLYYFKTHYVTASLVKEPQTEITGSLNRSDCGWYQLYSYYLRPESYLTPAELYFEETDETGYPYRLSLLEFNLAEYATGKLDKFAIKNIRQVLYHFYETDTKVIVRFLYDWDGLGIEKEPKDISIIQQHMKQTGAILNDFTDSIYTTQGIFIGSWAEMHDSKYLSAKDITTLLLTYADATSSDIYLAVRTPNHYRTIFEELKKNPQRYKNFDITADELKKRLGLYNDGMLGSVSDLGTYQGWNTPYASLSEEELRTMELDFQKELCLTVPNGGEAVNDNSYNDWKSAITDLRKMHISYLNQMHDEAVITKWKESTYKDSDSVYDGYSVYSYITDHLGARFVLRDCTLSYKPFQKEPAKGSITLENTGFSNLYHPKRFTLSLINESTGNRILLLDSKNSTDLLNPCNWNSGEKVTLPFSFSPLNLEDGTYILTAVLKDTQNKEIFSFANSSFQAALNGYKLGEITIKR